MRIILLKVIIKSRVKHSSERSRLSTSPEISVEHEMDMDTIEQLRSDSKLRHTVRKQLKDHGLLSDMYSTSSQLLLDFLLAVKAATLICISACGSAIPSAKEGKSGFIYNRVMS